MNLIRNIPLKGNLSTVYVPPLNHDYAKRKWLNPELLRGKLLNDAAKAFSKTTGIPTITAELSAVYRQGNYEVDLGTISYRVVTDVGVAFIVDAWQNSLELETMKYHGCGTDNTAEAAGDTDLIAELTTQLNPDNTRATGSLTEGATANIFKTVGTLSFDSSASVVEHGLFSNASVGSGVLFDRSVFTSIAVINGSSIQFTYEATFNSGS